ncbi:MAG: hypothetical protein IPI98_00395 [Chitinophagaceae bacterium]|nr:hypothetical protein [Chitinophagaceae bacterium]
MGDRLIDGNHWLWNVGGSYNYTYRAIHIIPKDIMICDWHYERADKSAVYFAMNGLNVVTSPLAKP